MFKQESNDTPRFLTVSDGLTTELPTVISLMFSLDTCLGVPIINRLTMMQHLVEFDQMWFIFQHSLPCCPHTFAISIAALGVVLYRRSHPYPQKSPQLQI